MPPKENPELKKSLQEVVDEIGLYPIEAYVFVQQGLGQTVNRLHGPMTDPDQNRHVSGPQLCEGLRDFALEQWGMLAGTVLRRWNITSTLDFGRIVFALVDNGFMQKTEDDHLSDFRGVFDFDGAFQGRDYRIEIKA